MGAPSHPAVLVLNADFRAIGSVAFERAMTLVVMGSADVIRDTGNSVHSQHLELPEPSVIKLNRYIHVPHNRPVPLSRKALFARDGGVCAFCEEPATTIDHVQPRSKGGRHEWNNVVACCVACNSRKADRTPEDAGMPLRFKPYTPTRSGMLLARRRPDWEDWLL